MVTHVFIMLMLVLTISGQTPVPLITSLDCVNASHIRFKPMWSHGERSLTNGTGPITILWDSTQPVAIIIQILDNTCNGDISACSQIYQGTASIRLDINIFPENKTIFEPTFVDVIYGEVYVKNLAFKKLLVPGQGTEYKITFTVSAPGEPVHGKTLHTGLLTVAKEPSKEIKSIRFAQYDSLFYLPAQTKELPLDVQLPFPIRVELLSDMLTLLTKQEAVVQLRSSNSNCGLSTTPFEKPTSVLTADVKLGVATFPKVTLSAESGKSCTWNIFVFSVPHVPELMTGNNSVVHKGLKMTHLWFENNPRNFARWPNQPPMAAAIVGEPIPTITLVVLDSSYEQDISQTGLVVICTPTKGSLTGDTVMLDNGIAQFKELTLSNFTDGVELIFTVKDPLSQKVLRLMSGTIKVQMRALRNAYLGFDERSWINSWTPRNWTKLLPFPPIIVRMLDSSLQYDPTGSDFNIRAHISGGMSLEGHEAVMSNGIAIFSSLRIRDIGITTFSLLFNVESARIPASENMHIIETAEITLIPQELIQDWRTSYLRFASSQFSLVYKDNQDIFATRKHTIPEIVVEVVSQIGLVHQPSAARMSVYTTDGEEDDEKETLFSVPVEGIDGRYRFTCLYFDSIPQNPVKLNFVIKPMELPGFVLRLQSGFVTVLDEITSSYAIRFRQLDSLITYEGERATSVQNIVLPPIIVELIDSAYNLDHENSDIVIVATDSAGALSKEGSAVNVNNGVATFSALRFTSNGRETILNFQVLKTSYPASQYTIRSGAVTVTEVVIPNAHFKLLKSASLLRYKTDDGLSTISYPMQPYRVSQLTKSLTVFLNLLDSSYALDYSNTDSSLSIEITVTKGILVVTRNLNSTTVTNVVTQPGQFFFNLTFELTELPKFEAFVTFTAKSAKSSPVIGKSIVIGPVYFDVVTDYSAICSNKFQEPIVIAEIAQVPDYTITNDKGVEVQKFSTETELKYRSLFAQLCGVSLARVSVVAVNKFQSVDQRTGFRWIGSKVEFLFGQPLLSSDTLTSAQAAEKFVLLKRKKLPDSIMTVYYKGDQPICVIPSFEAAWMDSQRKCHPENATRICQCYANHEVIILWARPCLTRTEVLDLEGKKLLKDLKSLCTKLRTCEEPTIKDACSDVDIGLIETTLPLPYIIAGGCLFFVAGAAWFFYRLVRYRKKVLFPKLEHKRINQTAPLDEQTQAIMNTRVCQCCQFLCRFCQCPGS